MRSAAEEQVWREKLTCYVPPREQRDELLPQLKRPQEELPGILSCVVECAPALWSARSPPPRGGATADTSLNSMWNRIDSRGVSFELPSQSIFGNF